MTYDRLEIDFYNQDFSPFWTGCYKEQRSASFKLVLKQNQAEAHRVFNKQRVFESLLPLCYSSLLLE